MSTPNETLIENIVIALVKTQSPFTNNTAAPVYNWDTTVSLQQVPDFVRVQASKPIPLVPAKDPATPAPVQQSTVTVEATLANKDVSKMDNWSFGIDAALATTTNAVNNLANQSFPNGFVIDVPQGGDRQPQGAEHRTRSRVFRVVFRT